MTPGNLPFRLIFPGRIYFCPQDGLFLKKVCKLKIIALTGGVGCGKTTASTLIRNHGIPCIDADRLCHELYAQPDSPLLRKMRGRWGDRIFHADGTVNRNVLGGIVFRDDAEREALNGLFRPTADAELERRIAEYRAQDTPLLLLDVPLLFESGWDRYADVTIAVWAPRALQLERVMKNRGWSEDELDRRRAAQMDETEKLERADCGIINSGGELFLARQCGRILDEIQQTLLS